MTTDERDILKRTTAIVVAQADQIKKLADIASSTNDILDALAIHVSVLEAEITALKGDDA